MSYYTLGQNFPLPSCSYTHIPTNAVNNEVNRAINGMQQDLLMTTVQQVFDQNLPQHQASNSIVHNVEHSCVIQNPMDEEEDIFGSNKLASKQRKPAKRKATTKENDRPKPVPVVAQRGSEAAQTPAFERFTVEEHVAALMWYKLSKHEASPSSDEMRKNQSEPQANTRYSYVIKQFQQRYNRMPPHYETMKYRLKRFDENKPVLEDIESTTVMAKIDEEQREKVRKLIMPLKTNSLIDPSRLSKVVKLPPLLTRQIIHSEPEFVTPRIHYFRRMPLEEVPPSKRKSSSTVLSAPICTNSVTETTVTSNNIPSSESTETTPEPVVSVENGATVDTAVIENGATVETAVTDLADQPEKSKRKKKEPKKLKPKKPVAKVKVSTKGKSTASLKNKRALAKKQKEELTKEAAIPKTLPFASDTAVMSSSGLTLVLPCEKHLFSLEMKKDLAQLWEKSGTFVKKGRKWYKRQRYEYVGREFREKYGRAPPGVAYLSQLHKYIEAKETKVKTPRGPRSKHGDATAEKIRSIITETNGIVMKTDLAKRLEMSTTTLNKILDKYKELDSLIKQPTAKKDFEHYKNLIREEKSRYPSITRQEIARSIGIGIQTLYNWLRKDEELADLIGFKPTKGPDHFYHK